MDNLKNKRLLSMKEAMYYTGLKQVKCREFVASIDAIVKIGSRLLVDRKRIDEAFDMRNGATFCQKRTSNQACIDEGCCESEG